MCTCVRRKNYAKRSFCTTIAYGGNNDDCFLIRRIWRRETGACRYRHTRRRTDNSETCHPECEVPQTGIFFKPSAFKCNRKKKSLRHNKNRVKCFILFAAVTHRPSLPPPAGPRCVLAHNPIKRELRL